MSSAERAGAVVFLILALAFAWGTKTGANSWAELSRLAAIDTLLERGTFRIDGSPFAAVTMDKVLIDGHYYCDKPPLLQLLATPIYAGLRAALAAPLTQEACPGAGRCAYKWLTFVSVGLPSAAAIGCLVSFALRRGYTRGRVLIVAGLSVFGTMIWPYSLVFNNHVPAAAAMLGCFLLALPAPDAEAGAARSVASGLLGGLAVGLDLMTVFPVAALGLLHWRRPRQLTVFALGAALPIAATAFADFLIWGSPLPPYFAPHGYAYPGSPFADSVGGLRPADDKWRYAVQGLVGARGLFAYSPVLLLALAGLLRVLRDRRRATFGPALAAAAGMLVFAVYIFSRTSVHGGRAYGERYFISIVLLLASFGLFALPDARPQRWLPALLVTVPLSVVSAAQGVSRTWERTPPVLFLRTQPRLAICSSLADPEHVQTRFGEQDSMAPCWPSGEPAEQRR